MRLSSGLLAKMSAQQVLKFRIGGDEFACHGASLLFFVTI
jgi:hypothetical protein